MNYKEALFFIGKCLTINHEAHNKKSVAAQLQTEKIDWDMVVQVSTAHYVFPALYLNLKKANFTEYLPEELVNYMDHITSLNRERNEAIINQVRELQKLLVANGIEPIFLKGSGNLVSGLYDDIAERMVGDIDFLVKENQAELAQHMLLDADYLPLKDGLYLISRHLKRLYSKSALAAVEVHKKIVTGPFNRLFSNHKLMVNAGTKNVLHQEDQLFLNIASHQINDKGKLKFQISLKNAYDVYLLSHRFNININSFQNQKYFDLINNYIYTTSKIFNSNHLVSIETQKVKWNFMFVCFFAKYRKFNRVKNKVIDFCLGTQNRLILIVKSMYSSEHRKFLLYLVRSKDWQERKLIQFGLKKPKPNE